MCTACHGADGTGNKIVGAPNLTDNIWLYGGSVNDIRETITNGRTNHMPAHLERLGDTKVRLLAAYVLSLSRGGPGRAGSSGA
jgi:cytochrome c oxidase cbb3-type subunit 3